VSRKLGFLLVCAAMLAQTAFASGPGSGQPQDPEQGRGVRRAQRPVANSYIVVLETAEDAEAVGRETEARHGGRRQHTYRGALRGFSMRLTRAAADNLARDPRVRYVEEDGIVEVSQESVPWGLDRIDQRTLPLSGTYVPGALGTGVFVHVVDTGVRASHQEFGGRAFIYSDYVDDDGDNDPGDVANDDWDPSTPDGADCHGHGTHVAGTIGGLTYGVARDVTIYAHRVLGCSGLGTTSGVIAALDAITLDARRPAVANMSLSGAPSDALDEAVRGSIAAGVTYAVAAGNDNVDAREYSPARVEDAITVGATVSTDARAYFSNYGPALDLFAPGVSVRSAWYTSDTAIASLSGTSMASPHVAGVAALYLETHPGSTPAEVRAAIVGVATPGVVASAGEGSPNLLLYSGFADWRDLVMDDAGAPPAQVAPGQSFAVTDTQRNAGGAEAAASVTAYYLSLDAVMSRRDILLTGGRAVPALPGGAVSTGSSTLTVPSTVALGPYTFFACADGTQLVPETDEANNCLASRVQVTVTLSDLVTSEVSGLTAGAAPGMPFSVTDTVQNVSAVSAGVSATRYYLSPDAVKDAGDVLLIGYRSVPILAGGAVSIGPQTVTVPAATALGTYRLLACADDLLAVRETDETNNCVASASTVLVAWPDLAATTLGSLPAGAAPGTSFSVTDTVQNAAAVGAGASLVRYYFSLDAVKDAGDVLLIGYRSVPTLAGGAISSGPRTVTVPAAMPLGSYRLLACADDRLAVKESNEANNCVASATTVVVGWPDLLTSTVGNPPASVVLGTSFGVTDKVQNAGAVSAGASTARYYLSLDAMKDAGDVLLTGYRIVPILAAGTVSIGVATVAVPATTGPGTYHLIGCSDAGSVVKESDEANNCAASATVVAVGWPDLVTSTVVNPPASAVPGTAFSVTDTVQNTGSVSAAASKTRYYLSLDAVKDAGDVLLTGYRIVPVLAGGGLSIGGAAVTVPATTVPGTYLVIACADAGALVKESNEANNCAASASAVVVGWPDLVASAVSDPPASALVGSPFSVTDAVQNAGSVNSAASVARYYLSLDAVKDAGDVLLTGYRIVPLLAPGAASSGSATVRVPAATVPGMYRLFSCADGGSVVKESNEANNCTASAMTVAIR
jgi:subtilisin family serine protease